MCDFQWCDVGSSYYITATGNYIYANLLDFTNIGILYPSYHGSCLTLTLTKTSRGTGGVLVFSPNLGSVGKITPNLKETNRGGISFFHFQGVRKGNHILRCLFSLRFQMDIKSAAPKSWTTFCTTLLQINMEPPQNGGGLQMRFLFQRRHVQVPAVHFAGYPVP